MNGFVEIAAPRNRVPRIARLPTVDEALPYSPLFSVIPFSHDLVPYPSPVADRYLPFTNREEHPASSTLNLIEHEAIHTPTSLRLQRTLEELKHLLDDERLTSFQFRRPSPAGRAVTTPTSNGHHAPSLSRLAQMVLNDTCVDYRYPTPDSPQPKKRHVPPSRKAVKREGISSVSVQIDHTPHRSSDGATIHPQQHTSRNLEVLVPSSSQASNYQEFPDIDAKVLAGENLYKKRGIPKSDMDNDGTNTAIDLRAQAENSVNRVQELLSDVIDAEDTIGTNGVDEQQTATHGLLETSAYADTTLPLLSLQTISKLLVGIQDVVSYRRFEDLPMEYLARIQTLCSRAVGTIDSQHLSVDGAWEDLDVQIWLDRVGLVETSLHAARLLLRLMIAGQHEKRLSSEGSVVQVVAALKYVIETCIIPSAEMRSSGSATQKFSILSRHKKALGSLFQMSSRTLELIGDLLAAVDPSDSSIASIEFLCKDIIFAENGHSEKESAVGVQKFEQLRLAAMNVLVKLFTRYPGQRQSIFHEILTSIGRLTTARQSARQYKLDNGKPIQLVSALLMRLVHACALPAASREKMYVQENEEVSRNHLKKAGFYTLDSLSEVDSQELLMDLKSAVRRIAESTVQSAEFVVGFLIRRAQNATKTGETPYRNLLDLFTEDFLSVLGLPDWPGAEILLYHMFQNMQQILQDSGAAVKAKNMALELLGKMGVGILSVQATVRNAMRSLDISTSNVAAKLLQLAEVAVEDGPVAVDTIDLEGPYRMVLEYLSGHDESSGNIAAARSLFLLQWTRSTLSLFESQTNSEDYSLPNHKALLIQLLNTLLDPNWLQHEYEFEDVSQDHGRLAAAIATLKLGLCRNHGTIMNLILSNLTSEHANLKARSLNCVEQLLKSNPDLLSKNEIMVFQVLRCCGDPKSSQARSEALRVLGSCLTINPGLDSSCYRRIISRLDDEYVSVRKQTLQLLKEIFLRNEADVETRSTIVAALMQKSKDADESVATSAQQLFEELWMQPFYKAVGNEEAQMRFVMRHQIALLIRIAKSSESSLIILESLIHDLLSSKAKQPQENLKVCRAIVSTLFESLVDNDATSENSSPQSTLQAIAVFAKANASLFVSQQLELLEPYIQQLSTAEDAATFRSSVTIFRHVFPSLSSVQRTFLERVQSKLFENMTRLGQNELAEVWPCLWAIQGELKNENRILRLTTSVLSKIQAMRDNIVKVPANDPALRGKVQTLQRLVLIAGNAGEHCDLEQFIGTFKGVLKSDNITSVRGLMVDYILPMTRQSFPVELRKTALESTGMICQASPELFMRSEVHKAFNLVFRNKELNLQQVVLGAFRSFFVLAEKRSESGAIIKVGEGGVHGSERLGKSLVATDSDSAAAGIAQQFLKSILQVALSDEAELAVTAVEILASISRQGLVHPRECGAALIALETSPNPVIADIAFKEHRAIHEKHESMFEKEYMKAIEQAFRYQRDVYGSPSGMHLHPPSAKLQAMFAVLDKGGAKVRKRFLTNLASRAGGEIAKLRGAAESTSNAMQLIKFFMENVAFFEYTRFDDVTVMVTSLEKVVATIGSSTAHAIETEILNVRIQSNEFGEAMQLGLLSEPVKSEHEVSEMVDAKVDIPAAPIAPDRLKTLATSSTGLLIIWKTAHHLRKMWNIGKHYNGQKEAAEAETGAKVKGPSKDISRPAVKKSGYSPDEYIRLINGFFNGYASGEGEAEMVICHAFAKVMSEDSEHRVPNEDGDEHIGSNGTGAQENGYDTPSEHGASNGRRISTPAKHRGRKRRGSTAAAAEGTPKRPKAQRSTPTKRGRGLGMRRTVSFASTAEQDGDDSDDEGDDQDAEGDEDGGWD